MLTLHVKRLEHPILHGLDRKLEGQAYGVDSDIKRAVQMQDSAKGDQADVDPEAAAHSDAAREAL